ncbi:MAG: hypothetical protein Q9170_001068 [Blastenia crenularia]
MARKHKKKPTVVGQRTTVTADMSANSTRSLLSLPGATLNAPSSSKSADNDSPPAKRLKTNHDRSLSSASLAKAATSHCHTFPVPVSHEKAGPAASSLPLEVQHLQSQYHFSTMSIISSSKINQKVKVLLDRVEKSNIADISGQSEVVIVSAKAGAASKMISVVEIAKRDIDDRGGKWHAYSMLRSELLQLRTKQRQRSQAATTLVDRGSERASHSVLRQPSAQEATDDWRDTGGVETEDEGEAFETLQQPSARPVVIARTKVRETPIMTVFFSCEPIPGLRDHFG